MKKLTILVAAMLTLGISPAVFAQQQTQVQTQAIGAPQAFKYQAVARDANGDAIANQSVSFRITILQGSAEGTNVYQETQTVTTNQFGLANLAIGNGSLISGVFNTIDWSAGSYFIKTEFDPKGGDNYTAMGTSQMLSVPYSLYAEHSKLADSVSEFPITAALKGTNLQAPFKNPKTGMLVYNTDSTGIGTYAVVPGYYYNAGTETDPNWILLSGIDAAKSVHSALAAGANVTTYGGLVQDGGANHNAYAGFGGTIGAPTGNDNTGFGTDVFGIAANTTGADNTGIGYDALNANTSGAENVAVGSGALIDNSVGGSNVAMGYQAMDLNTYCGNNVAVGAQALYTQSYTNANSAFNSGNTAIGNAALYTNNPNAIGTGINNTAVGYESFYDNTYGYYNTGSGSQAGYSNTNGNGNSYFGYYSGYQNTTGGNNTGIGALALQGVSGSSTGNYNTAVGYEALYVNTSGAKNTAVGDGAMVDVSTGVDNTSEGYVSLRSNTTGSSNTAIGSYALAGSGAGNAGSWNTAVGDSAMLDITTGTYNTSIGYQSMLGITTGSENDAIGHLSLYSNTSGGSNLASGYSSLYKNTSGSYNTASGYYSLYSNTTGSYSTAYGYNTLQNCTSEYNTAVGANSLQATTTGNNNAALGISSLFNNTTGLYNTATGAEALYSSTTASSNTASGHYSLYSSTGDGNSAFGDSAGYFNTSGVDNTYIGFKAGDNSSLNTLSNVTCLGFNSGASTTNTPVSDNIYLGNSSIVGLYCEVQSISAYSDRRIKDNIKENVPGLAFITKLRPVTYNLNIHRQNEIMGVKDDKDYIGKYDVEKITESGFIAQEVDSAARACGYDFNGISRPKNPDGLYSLGYTDFVMPLVKAVQEQQQMIDSLKKVNTLQADNMRSLQTAQAQLKQEQDDKMASQEKEISELKKMFNAMTAQASIK